jgi:hypothetical protein
MLNRIVTLIFSKFPLFLNQVHLFNNRASSSHVGPVAVGVFSKEEKAGQEEFGGPQTLSVDERNPSLEQGKLRCI